MRILLLLEQLPSATSRILGTTKLLLVDGCCCCYYITAAIPNLFYLPVYITLFLLVVLVLSSFVDMGTFHI